ncbi:hypothetical protein TWF481_007242 [Arthrobotrys musiformis]|uniref:Uncharacterized protein n=1 Tax=Arthrobotrys musiformis TaxID=47236 RepID=A0AAV9WGM5_9PEZI
MSSSVLSQSQCSADASSGVDGSRTYHHHHHHNHNHHHPLIASNPTPTSTSASTSALTSVSVLASPASAASLESTSSPSSHFRVSDLQATSMSTSTCPTDAGSKLPHSPSSSSSFLQLPEAPDTDLTDEPVLDLLSSLPLLKTDCQSLPSNADASSPSNSGVLGLSSPRTRSPTLSNSSATVSSSSSSLHDDGLADGGVSLQHHGFDGPSWPSNIAENNGVPLFPPSVSHLEPERPNGANMIQGDRETLLLSTTTDAPGETEPPVRSDPLSSSQDSGINLLAGSPITGTVPASPVDLTTGTQDVLMESASENADFSSDEEYPDRHHTADHGAEYLVTVAPTQPSTVPSISGDSESSPAGVTLDPTDQLLEEAPPPTASPADLAYEVWENGNDFLAEFDFDTFLQQPEPMELDNPTFNPNTTPQNIPAITNVPPILFPHFQAIPQEWLTNHTNLPFGIFQGNGNAFFGFTTAMDDDSPEWPGPQFHGEYEKNLSFPDFCSMLSAEYRQDPVGNAECKINQDFIEILNFHLPAMVHRSQVDEYRPDYQGIPWRELDMERHRFRLLRNRRYKNYANMTPYPEPHRMPRFLPIRESYFRFRKTCNTVDVKFSHFQLRNVISSTSKNDVFYTGDSTVMRYDPQCDAKQTIMDLRRPRSGDPIKITTLASDFGVIIAGGFYGEYAMLSLDSPIGTKPIEGLVTTDSNGITNHVHFFKSRTAGTPQAVFSSNDERLRILDCNLNKMVAEHKLPWAINCADTSPDGRLRVIVGDAKEVVIQGTDDGETIHRLPGHLDYGFACAWSDDGHTIATGNQDKMVRVYDARNFKREVAVLDADIAGARSLRFTPVGSGPRVLAFAEPADMVSIVDAVTWESRQRIDFFGEIAGITFSPDGRDLYIANSDKMVGGLMKFDRWKTGYPDYPENDGDDAWRQEADDVGEPPISRRRMRLRDVNMDNLGIV